MVVLPAPLGPSRPNTSPRATVKSTPRSAACEPYALLSPVTSIAGTPLVIASIMATSLARACSAAASTSGRTPRACWSPTRATARLHGGPAAARVHPPGPRAGARRRRSRPRGSPRPRASSPSSSRWPSRLARDDPHRRHRRASARAANRDEFCRRDARARRRRGVRARRRGGGAAGLPRRDAHARPAAAGRVAVVDVGGGSTEIAVGTLDRRRRVVALVRVRLGLPRRRLPGRRPADARRAATRSATHAAQMLAGIAPPPVDAAVAVGGSAASLRRLVGDDARPRRASRARCGVLTSGPAADVAARFDLDAQRVRLMPAGLLALDAAAHALGPAAADRPRRPARGRAARPGRACNNSFTNPRAAECDDSRGRDRRHQRTRDRRQRPTSRIRRSTSTASCRWMQFNERVLELAEDPSVPLLERVKFLRDLLVQPRRVLHGPRRRPARPDRRRHREAAAGRAHAERDDRGDPRRSCASTPRASRAAWTATCGPRWPSTASGSSRYDEVDRARAARASTSASGARSSRC